MYISSDRSHSNTSSMSFQRPSRKLLSSTVPKNQAQSVSLYILRLNLLSMIVTSSQSLLVEDMVSAVKTLRQINFLQSSMSSKMTLRRMDLQLVLTMMLQRRLFPAMTTMLISHRKAPLLANSGVLALMVLLALISLQSKSLATTPTFTLKHTSLMIPRSPAVSQ